MIHRKRLITLVLVALVTSASDVAAQITPFTVWTSDARSLLPLWVQYWIYFMFLMTAIGLFFVKNHVEARWGVGAFVASHLASAVELFFLGAENFVIGMIAINHCVFWTPAALYLARRLKKNSWVLPFGIWHVAMLGMLVFSLFFDYRDAFTYLLRNPVER